MNEKRLSLAITLLILIVSIAWLIRTKDQMFEPIISSIAAFGSLILQYLGWRTKSIKSTLEAPNNGVPQSVSRLFDFARDKCEIIIKPHKMPQNYWRIGFKMSPIVNVSAGSYLEIGTVLFSIEQTDSRLTSSYHQDGTRVGDAFSLSENYRYETISIIYQENGQSIDFIIKVNNRQLRHFSIPSKYRYGRLISFADNHIYKIDVTINDI